MLDHPYAQFLPKDPDELPFSNAQAGSGTALQGASSQENPEQLVWKRGEILKELERQPDAEAAKRHMESFSDDVLSRSYESWHQNLFRFGTGGFALMQDQSKAQGALHGLRNSVRKGLTRDLATPQQNEIIKDYTECVLRLSNRPLEIGYTALERVMTREEVKKNIEGIKDPYITQRYEENTLPNEQEYIARGNALQKKVYLDLPEAKNMYAILSTSGSLKIAGHVSRNFELIGEKLLEAPGLALTPLEREEIQEKCAESKRFYHDNEPRRRQLEALQDEQRAKEIASAPPPPPQPVAKLLSVTFTTSGREPTDADGQLLTDFSSGIEATVESAIEIEGASSSQQIQNVPTSNPTNQPLSLMPGDSPAVVTASRGGHQPQPPSGTQQLATGSANPLVDRGKRGWIKKTTESVSKLIHRLPCIR